MNLDGGTLVDWLEKQSRNNFPNHEDYITQYKSIKNYLDEHIHPFIELVVYKKEGIELTKHGVEHIDKVIERASDLVSSANIKLSAYEVYMILIAIQIHDSGHIINGREKHEKFSRDIILGIGKLMGSKSPEKMYIYKIAEAHGGLSYEGEKDKISLLDENDTILNKPIRPRLMSSIVRFADELADDYTRSSKSIDIKKGSEIFHKYASSLHTVEVDHKGKQINMFFNLSKENVINKYGKGRKKVFLLDEIFERVFKTFQESLYCNRFFKNDLIINIIHAKIEFIDDEELQHFFKPISIKLQENGYPYSNKETIYDICGNDLILEGKGQITGNILSRHIKP
jgi:hypothetical protein